MAGSRKRGKERSGKKPAVRPAGANDVKRSPGDPTARKCWLCSLPLGSDTVASVLGPGMFEVHQRCYEQAMRS